MTTPSHPMKPANRAADRAPPASGEAARSEPKASEVPTARPREPSRPIEPLSQPHRASPASAKRAQRAEGERSPDSKRRSRAQRAEGERSPDNWRWQLQNRIRSAADLESYLNPTDDERRAIAALADRFHFVITPYYASLMDPDDPDCPIRRQVVPRGAELDDPAGLADPLDEVAHSPVKNVIRVYPDRIAFCVNNECALYCRFCLRKRMVGDSDWAMQRRELSEVALDWIRRTPEIRDVLLTGGDPLVFSDDRLEWLLGASCARSPTWSIIRLGTRLPVTLPLPGDRRAVRHAGALPPASG